MESLPFEPQSNSKTMGLTINKIPHPRTRIVSTVKGVLPDYFPLITARVQASLGGPKARLSERIRPG
jgi:hypothetical protein